jgi:hypothetical protein
MLQEMAPSPGALWMILWASSGVQLRMWAHLKEPRQFSITWWVAEIQDRPVFQQIRIHLPLQKISVPNDRCE